MSMPFTGWRCPVCAIDVFIEACPICGLGYEQVDETPDLDEKLRQENATLHVRVIALEQQAKLQGKMIEAQAQEIERLRSALEMTK